MAYLTSVPLRRLAALPLLGVIVACNPDNPGSESTGASSSSSSTGEQPTTGGSTDAPTTGTPTTSGTVSATDSATDSVTGTTTDTSSTGTTTDATTTDPTTGATTTADTTTGELACGDDAEFTASWDAWQAAVEANGPTYFYSVLRSGANFMDPNFCLYRTLVVVVDGVVVERRFEVDQMVGEPMCDAPFIEKDAEVGTNMPEFAALPVTIDALYGACCDMVIHVEPAEEFMVTFETDADGLMKTCYHVANGCADDCASGPLGSTLDIETLEFGAPPP